MTFITNLNSASRTPATSHLDFNFENTIGDTEGRDEFYKEISKGKPLTAESLAAAIAAYTIKGEYIAAGKGSTQMEKLADAFDIDLNNPVFKKILAATDSVVDAKGRTQYNVKSLAAQILKEFDCEKNGIDRASYFSMIDVLSGDKAEREAKKNKKGEVQSTTPQPTDIRPRIIKKD